ncbi:MAG: Wadjet anti-phage system protein JetD domain-containing protein [Phototrophicaceae bacterium]
MISPEEIRHRATREYPRFVSQWLKGERFEGLDFPAGGLPSDALTLRDTIDLLKRHAKTEKQPGYSITWVTRRTKQLGTQTVPHRIRIQTESDLIALADKQHEFEQFTEDVASIRAGIPQLEEWLHANWKQVVKYRGAWPDLLTVCRMWADRAPGSYLREIPLPVPTKFVERHTAILQQLLDRILPAESVNFEAPDFWSRYRLKQDEPFVRFRFLDRQLERLTGLKIDDLAVPVNAASALPIAGQDVVVVENKTSLLMIGPRENTVAIFGGGFGVEILGSIDGLRHCRVFYWGDFDAQGFEILSLLRSRLPHVQSVLMHRNTLHEFEQFIQQGNPAMLKDLPNLTADELEAYQFVTLNNLRLEQERIPVGRLSEALELAK